MKRAVRAVYPGSFDPITNGHIYIAERAAAIFDEVRVSILVNPQKRSTFSVEERHAMAREALSYLPNVTVGHFTGLLVDYLRQEKARAIIRGLRAMSDFEYEFQMTAINYQLDSALETVFIMSPPQYMYLSSSIVRELAELHGDFASFVPPCVAAPLADRFA